MSKVSKAYNSNTEKLRSSSSSSFTGLRQQMETNKNSRRQRGCNSNLSCDSDNSHNARDQQETFKPWTTKKNKPLTKPSLEQLGKENIKRPSNDCKRRSPHEFFEQEVELQKLKQAKKQLEQSYIEEVTLKEQQINSLFKLKEQNHMNLEEMSKLRHLISQFQGQLHKINKEKESCEVKLKEAMEKISCLKDQHPLELQAKHHRHQIEQYERIIESNKSKFAKYEQQLKQLTEAIQTGNKEKQKLKENLLITQSHQESQQQSQSRLNQYIIKASEAQNRANELQIKYFRIQKENDDSKQAKEEATYQIQQLLRQIEQQKHFYNQEENTLLSKIKLLESQKRRVEIERATAGHEKQVLFSRLKKEKEAEIDRLKLELDKSAFELQEKIKELTCLQTDRQNDTSSLKLRIESMQLTLKKEKMTSQQLLQKYQSQIKTKKAELQVMSSELLDHVQVIKLLQKKLSQQSEQKDTTEHETRAHYERTIEEKSKQIQSLIRENESRQESMLRYSGEMQSIKIEFRSILEERDATLRQYQYETDQKDRRIEQLEKYLQSNQIHFEKQFENLHTTIECSQTRLNAGYKAELERRDTIINTTENTLRQTQIEIASLKSNLEAALASNQELKEQSVQMKKLFTQTKVDISSLRSSFIDENNSKQSQLAKMIEGNQRLQSENRKISNQMTILKEKSEQLREQCRKLRSVIEQQQFKQRQLAIELQNSKSANAKLVEEKLFINQLRQNEYLELKATRQNMISEAVQANTAKLQSIHNTQIQLLKSEVMILKSHQSRLQEDVNKKQKEVFTLQNQNRKLQSLLANQIRSQSGLKMSYENKQYEIEDQRRELLSKEEEMRRMNSKVNELQCKMETLQLQLATEKQIIYSLRQENTVLKQSEKTLKFHQQSKNKECAQYQREKKQLQKTIEIKTNELALEFQKRAQLEQTIIKLNEQIMSCQAKLAQMNKTQTNMHRLIENKSAQLDQVRRALETEMQQRMKFQRHIQDISQLRTKKQQQQTAKSTLQITNLRRNLQSCLREYESLRVTQEAASNKLLSMKSQRDNRLLELQEAKMKIRVLESENRSIQTIMAEELDKRKRLIEELVKEKNNAVGEMERSKISKY